MAPISSNERLDSCILDLANNLRNMADDVVRFGGYDREDLHSCVERYRLHMKDAVDFLAGAHVCSRYLNGFINLDTFCTEMISDNLKSFLSTLPNIPTDLVIKHGLESPHHISDIDMRDFTTMGNTTDCHKNGDDHTSSEIEEAEEVKEAEKAEEAEEQKEI